MPDPWEGLTPVPDPSLPQLPGAAPTLVPGGGATQPWSFLQPVPDPRVPATTLRTPPPSGGTWGSMFGNVAAGLGQNLAAGMQATSPVVSGLTGQSNYQSLGPLINSDAGPAFADASGNWNLVNPEKHVVLNDPQTGQPTVYARSSSTNEPWSAIGRMLGWGASAP